MVRARIQVKPSFRKKLAVCRVARNGRQHLKVSELRSESAQRDFNLKMTDLLSQRWPECVTVQDKLAALVDTTMEVAEEVLPLVSRRTADWFLENEHIIRPALEKRNNLLRVWLSTKRDSDQLKFKKQKSAVQRLIRQVKNKWFQDKAVEIEREMGRSRSAWKSIKQLQQASFGLRPAAPRGIRNEDGLLCKSAEECKERWRRHFERVLNVVSHFDGNIWNAVWQRPQRSDLDVDYLQVNRS